MLFILFLKHAIYPEIWITTTWRIYKFHLRANVFVGPTIWSYVVTASHIEHIWPRSNVPLYSLILLHLFYLDGPCWTSIKMWRYICYSSYIMYIKCIYTNIHICIIPPKKRIFHLKNLKVYATFSLTISKHINIYKKSNVLSL